MAFRALIACWQAADSVNLAEAGFTAASGFAAGAAMAGTALVLRVARETSSRSAFMIVIVPATRLTTLPSDLGCGALLAFAVRVAIPMAAIAPVIIALIRTIGPPWRDSRLLKRERLSPLTPG